MENKLLANYEAGNAELSPIFIFKASWPIKQVATAGIVLSIFQCIFDTLRTFLNVFGTVFGAVAFNMFLWKHTHTHLFIHICMCMYLLILSFYNMYRRVYLFFSTHRKWVLCSAGPDFSAGFWKSQRTLPSQISSPTMKLEYQPRLRQLVSNIYEYIVTTLHLSLNRTHVYIYLCRYLLHTPQAHTIYIAVTTRNHID